MTLFNSQNPRIVKAQAQVVETLSAIPEEYGAVFVIDEYQEDLRQAVRAHVEAQRMAIVAEHAAALNAKGRRGRRRGTVVDLTGRRVA